MVQRRKQRASQNTRAKTRLRPKRSKPRTRCTNRPTSVWFVLQNTQQTIKRWRRPIRAHTTVRKVEDSPNEPGQAEQDHPAPHPPPPPPPPASLVGSPPPATMIPSRCLGGERACSAGGIAPPFVRARACTSENKPVIGQIKTRHAFRQTRKNLTGRTRRRRRQRRTGASQENPTYTFVSEFVTTFSGRNCTPILGKNCVKSEYKRF